ncbi:MAG: glycosyltransferase family 4 protein [Sedimentisphaerales bacterium]|nr:glycosyltransferase family 4 protein [Sedimentisphaerales bacterium]
MRIVHLAPGAGGGFYCENCVRDAMMLRQLCRLGHEAIALPMYLPAGPEQQDIPKGPLFFGGINVYLQQKLGLFRHTPRWLDALLDSPRLLSRAARQAGVSNVKQLGETTISMLQGQDGKQVKELDRLIEWLILPENRPDVVVLSNALLMGVVGPIRQKLGCAVISLLQDEDGFVDGLGQPWSGQVWELMRRCAANVDLFVAVSRYYLELMTEKLALKTQQIQVAYPGLELSEYPAAQKKGSPLTLGYLARLCPDNGFDMLVDAVIGLAAEPGLPAVKLIASGGQTAADKNYIDSIKRKIRTAGMQERVEFREDFSLDSRKAFFAAIDLMCVPFRKPVAYGLCVLESMASGVGFIAPAAGVFPEYADCSGAGILVEPNSCSHLMAALRGLICNPAKIHDMGQKGHQAALQHFDIKINSKQYEKLLEGVLRK